MKLSVRKQLAQSHTGRGQSGQNLNPVCLGPGSILLSFPGGCREFSVSKSSLLTLDSKHVTYKQP